MAQELLSGKINRLKHNIYAFFFNLWISTLTSLKKDGGGGITINILKIVINN